MRIPAASPDASYAALVFDDDGGELRQFRSTTELPAADLDDMRELTELRCSGSAQPSVAGFRELQRRLAGVRDEELCVVDLRQESHGFVNGAAVSWYATNNWGCTGLSNDEALALEALRLRLLELATRVRIGSVATIKHGAEPAFVEWDRPTVADEPQAFGLPHGRHVRLPVTDHARPSNAVVDRFIELVRGLRGAQHLHFHCRGGKGRTATFMALHDLLRHGARRPLSDILARQRILTGYDLTRPADPTRAKAPYVADRLAFLERFHAYVQHNPGGEAQPWSLWLAAQQATAT
ncbi:MAG TPA: hypothetical protein VLM79_22990 [Kofleriaceae bacterium]|nr:hypothetical protein [Kofleriaceae bacterium]